MNRERLFARLGPICYSALIDATALGRSRNHAFVDLDHWALCLLEREQSDIALLLVDLGCDVAQIRNRLKEALLRVRESGDSLRDISAGLEQSIAPAISWSQVAAHSVRVRSGHLLLAWLDDATTRRWLHRLDPSGLGGMTLDELVERYETMAAKWPEASDNRPVAGAEVGEHAADALSKWATCLTAQAAEGMLDPVVGRHEELRAVIDTLLRRRQNNPILVGEAGVGKTAVAEALAQQIHAGNVPTALRGAQLWALDITRMQAGASARGEFEQRLRSVIDAVVQAPNPIILFCDEAHTLIGAGGAAGTGDAVNLIKPMLARGQLRMIAATTWAEYKQFIEPDAALTRRFQPVFIDEPGDTTALDMLRVIAPRFAAHHGVRISDAALEAAVRLSRRYLPARQLPDKAIGLLDTACARLAMNQSSTPAAMGRLEHDLLTVDQALQWRANDHAMGLSVPPGEELKSQRHALNAQLGSMQGEIQGQREVVRKWLALLETSEQKGAPAPSFERSTGEPIWIKPWVDGESIAEVLSEWTGIPSSQLTQDDADRVGQLDRLLNERVRGQAAALGGVARALQVSSVGLNDPRRPLGVILLSGPTGTGKSQTAAALADLLFGGERHLIQFNMNEFQESHALSTLKGAPPGYVGYGKGGRLTEAVRRKPYSVLLLDEFDRAHPDIHEMFFQVFDQGWMEDGEGRRVSFRNCLILLTSNQGEMQITAACKADAEVSQSRLDALGRESLKQVFSPALLARMHVTAFRPLALTALEGIARQALEEMGQRLADRQVGWSVSDSVAPWIASAVLDHPSGGRAVRDFLRQNVMPRIAIGLLDAQSHRRPVARVSLHAGEGLELDFEEAAPPLNRPSPEAAEQSSSDEMPTCA
jgi:type VI secretion system protein VasG